MTNRLPIAVCLSALLLAACGNKADLLMPAQVPPEDAGRYLIKSSVPTQEERDAAEDAAHDGAATDDQDDADDGDAGVIDADGDGWGDDVDTGVDDPPPVPVILDVPTANP